MGDAVETTMWAALLVGAVSYMLAEPFRLRHRLPPELWYAVGAGLVLGILVEAIGDSVFGGEWWDATQIIRAVAIAAVVPIVVVMWVMRRRNRP